MSDTPFKYPDSPLRHVVGDDKHYYVTVANNRPTCFFVQNRDTPEDIRPPLPANAVETDEETWHDWMTNNDKYIYDGKSVVLKD